MKNIIEVRELTKIYNQPNSDLIIFENLSFDVKKGDFIAITGPSGSGKSTLLNIISTLDSRYNGEVKFNDIILSKADDKKKTTIRLKDIGFVFQFDSLLEELNVIENIELPQIALHKKRNDKRVIESLKKMNLENTAFKKTSELSGGEKQRIAIIRAMINNPQIIIADEPTGNLDYENALKVMNDFQKLNNEGVTIIMVTHNTELARKFSKKIYSLTRTELKKIYEMPEM